MIVHVIVFFLKSQFKKHNSFKRFDVSKPRYCDFHQNFSAFFLLHFSCIDLVPVGKF